MTFSLRSQFSALSSELSYPWVVTKGSEYRRWTYEEDLQTHIYVHVHVCSVNNMRGCCSRDQNLEGVKIKPGNKANNQKYSSLN